MKEDLTTDVKEVLKKHGIDNFSLSYVKEGGVAHVQSFCNIFEMLGILDHAKAVTFQALAQSNAENKSAEKK